MLTIFLASLGTFIVGGAIGMVISEQRRHKLSVHCEVQQKQIEDLQQQLEKEQQLSQQRLDAQKKELVEGFNKLQDAQDQRHKDAIANQQTLFNNTIQSLTAEVKTATEGMLKERQKDFSESSLKDINNVVAPLKETLETMRKTIDDDKESRTRLGGELKQNLTSLMQHTADAKQSADELARVFKHETKVQGDWGELVLSDLLASTGLKEGVHFDTQVVIRDSNGNIIRTENGASLRPDVILHLDTKREVVIDSKVSLTAYFDFVNAENDIQRSEALTRHVKSIEKHVDELSKKDYASFIKLPKVKMDFVIMFVPHTAALQTAMQTKPELWRNALNRNIFIVDEQTLYAALRIINMTWTQIRQAENHQLLYEMAQEIVDRVAAFYSIYQKVGKAIGEAGKQYDIAEKKLLDKGQSIIKSCNKLLELGVKPKPGTTLPNLLDVSEIEQIASTDEATDNPSLSA